MKKTAIRKIYRHNSKNDPMALRILKKFPDLPIEIISSEGRDTLFSKSLSEGKKELLITESAGAAFKPCPGTDDSYICCNYWVLNQATNCPIDCSYCILQYYLNNPVLTLNTNIEDMKREIRERIACEPDRFFRIGTGEMADSLALDGISAAAEELIAFAAEEKRFLLELKTKTDNIDHLLDLPHHGYTVLSWSLNPRFIIQTEEHGSASLEERLRAAAKAEKAGYKLAFHFDPILHYPEWRQGYEETIERLFDCIDSASVAWISMGSLRYPPEMKDKAREKFPASPVFLAEMVPGKDNKMRYFKGIRMQLYQHVLAGLRKYGSQDLFIYFCMEDREIWRRVMGYAPQNNQELDRMFHESLARRFPDLQLCDPEFEEYQKFTTPRRRGS